MHLSVGGSVDIVPPGHGQLALQADVDSLANHTSPPASLLRHCANTLADHGGWLMHLLAPVEVATSDAHFACRRSVPPSFRLLLPAGHASQSLMLVRACTEPYLPGGQY